jgi:isopentenyl diphosphate isomerase/L-lactate dehydrogenase-like FMN-dependent dehydrogenase
VRNGFRLPPHLHLANFAVPGHDATIGGGGAGQSGLAVHVASQLDQTLSWRDVGWLRTLTSLPIVVKGIQTAEDARLAVAHGCAAVWVSNHGARQLDGVAATMDLLPEIVAAVDGHAEVYVDGGVRRYRTGTATATHACGHTTDTLTVCAWTVCVRVCVSVCACGGRGG